MAVGVRTLAWPVRREGTGIASCEHGSLQAVQESVQRIAAIQIGELRFQPQFGLPALELRSAIPDAADIEQRIETQQPSAAVTVTNVPNPRIGEGWEALAANVELAGEAEDDGD